MKKIVFLSLLMVSSVFATQAQITLTQSNYVLQSMSIHTNKFIKLSANPTPTTSGMWADTTTGAVQSPVVFSKDTATKFLSNSYSTEGLGYFLSVPYTVKTYWRENANGVFIVGYSSPYQAIGLGSVTSNPKDTLYIQNNLQYYNTDSVTSMKFPATYLSGWKSRTKHKLQIVVTIAAGFLKNTPGEIVSYQHHRDSIIGWGTLSVHSKSTPFHSIPYAVLMDKSMDFNVDSFYLSGKPANALLLSSLGLSQGEKSSINCRYNFYRANSFNPLMIVNYSADSGYTKQTSVVYNTDSITPATGTEEISKGTFTTLMYPNPVKANNVTVKIFGYDASVVNCRIYDVTGHEILNTRLNSNGLNTFNVPVTKELSNGLYIIQMTDVNNSPILSESLMIQR